ncbi:hypothetical protein M0R45_017519 [Rubus argutus]|uniref:Uncharacterized protein n=1 Tax=Rubus argutus TaxID=59490 RepID=A0AAW1XVY7_RUBAR
MLEYGEHGPRHRPKRRCISPVSGTDCPIQECVNDYHSRRQLEPIQELLKRSFHFGHDSFQEGNHVGGTVLLRWDNVGDIVAKGMLSGLASEPIKPSHSSVRTTMMRISGLCETSKFQRFIMGFM